jgi:uncharacterized protein
MKPSRWFLPETPDVLGALDRQLAVTIEGMDEFARWAAGDASAGERVRTCEHRADEVKREVLESLRAAFVTPLEPEDLFALSRGVDWILNHAKDTVGESEVMSCAPDAALAEMAALLAGATRSVAASIAALQRGGAEVDGETETAIRAERKLEKVYRRAMAELLEDDDLRELVARRELYRRCSRIGEGAADAAERVIYAVVKES